MSPTMRCLSCHYPIQTHKSGLCRSCSARRGALRRSLREAIEGVAGLAVCRPLPHMEVVADRLVRLHNALKRADEAGLAIDIKPSAPGAQ